MIFPNDLPDHLFPQTKGESKERIGPLGGRILQVIISCIESDKYDLIVITTVEWLKYLRPHVLRNTAPGIGNAEAHHATLGGFTRDRHRATGFIVLDRVGDQVQQDLAQPLAIGPNRR